MLQRGHRGLRRGDEDGRVQGSLAGQAAQGVVRGDEQVRDLCEDALQADAAAGGGDTAPEAACQEQGVRQEVEAARPGADMRAGGEERGAGKAGLRPGAAEQSAEDGEHVVAKGERQSQRHY